tara:strand:+ start:864 stop:1109 length:246 start_codon:yes stop_codon:yes gene_type:complete
MKYIYKGQRTRAIRYQGKKYYFYPNEITEAPEGIGISHLVPLDEDDADIPMPGISLVVEEETEPAEGSVEDEQSGDESYGD